MTLPVNRDEFKEYCLRKLGDPVIEINVDDQQVEDRIDDAISYYRDYHFDGTERTFLAHPVTSTDITNKYITTASNIIAVNRVFDIGDANNSTNNLFNLRYQISLNDLYDWSATQAQQYYMTQEHVSFLEYLFVGKQPFRWNRHVNRLYIDMDWSNSVVAGNYIVAETYTVVDPDTYTDMWADRWLLRYAPALIKQQWGQNLIKYEQMQLPGGIIFNGRQTFDDAQAEVDKLEEEMMSSYSLPVMDMVG
tara:strand:+ start:1957 stop:2703 length:747 start_codon:yes stop_codon:yes gene_type:complete